MTAVEARPQVTPEALLAMPDGERYELVDGELVGREMGALSSWVGGEAFARIRNFNAEHDLGTVFNSECGYRCFPDDPAKVRRPDASFVSRERLAAIPEGYVTVAPDLVVEVISPNDLFYEVEAKVGEYLAAEVRLVWVINPRERTAHVYRPDGSGARLHEDDVLDGEDVLPGFRCRLGELLP